ncbi:EutP/PduV family microcompartment system protein [Fictibacillus gelatini]|uniref:EutP/PduV family microcompartment system protein n=1 Tax=Fictibacillus gelatini TaxID=225985 RepID=UPI0004220C59|nr:EutP/PduV family microcompartment system protein [Fictibacillus gelatini]
MEKKNRVMIIGAIGAGKSTLTNALLGIEREARKTQSLTFLDWIVDTPGEYAENPLYYKSIMATALEVTHTIYLQDATSAKSIFPPGFATGIPKLPIGVVTKEDKEGADVSRAIKLLKQTINKGPIVITSAYTKKGIGHIPNLVKCNSMKEIFQYYSGHCDDETLVFI